MATEKSIAAPLRHRKGLSSDSGRYLIFALAGDRYAIEVHRVQQIRGWAGVSGAPNAPGYVLGVTDLRGNDLYVVDLRKRLALDSVPPGARTLVIVVGYADDGANWPVGFAVDSVSDVIELTVDKTETPADSNSPVSSDFVRGLASAGGQRIILLEIDRLIDRSLLSRGAITPLPDSRQVH